MTIIANTRKTAVRVADVTSAVFREHFPIGEKMNEDTHIFDSSFFEKDGKVRCFMAALPIEVAEELAARGAKAAGSIHRVERIETAEHLAFRKFCPMYETVLIFLSQDNGYRILHIADNLPAAAHFISNSPAHRADEFILFYNSLENKPKIAFVETEGDFEWLEAFNILEVQYGEQKIWGTDKFLL